ncbi:major facilitator superfamily protein [Lentilactobacillus kefiri DSM 20587 = JCM 5818]|uniref:Major facilitator superfamily protein n=1 Tax=Lentilactobacillus kefiri DSM 20587 = JCM 5818 TaxID=1423764 RepID=A0A8E1RKL3_LENKE|nr:MFS transporter [Lentilactobacillus kefiri]KRL72286.1 major facilitator superfamily protein [Lentilactobacillus parakefiri DSM 10551]KRM53933.1 major facilitator superfamily protein [Lentilactobacillus kefiri DSM 20587 = JCM 5818]
MNSTVNHQNDRSKNHPFLVITVVAFMTFMGVLTETSMNVTFPTLMKQFNISLSTVQWVTTGYLLMVALLTITSAYLKRRFTNKQLFVSAALLFITGDIMCGLAPSYWVLLVGRLIQAGCVGLTGPLMNNIILEIVPVHKLGTYMGMANLIVLVAPALGPTFGGAVVSFASWRMIFWITVPITVILLVLGLFIIKQYSSTEHYEFDWVRFGVLALGMITLLLGFNIMGQPGVLVKFISYMLVSAALFTTFGWLSKRSHKALFKLSVFKRPVFLFSFLPYVFLQYANIGINFMLPSYVQMVNGAAAVIGGLILLPGSIFNGLGQPIYGWMLDRFGGKLPLYLGNSLFLVPIVVMMIMGQDMSVLIITILYTIFATGRSMAFGNSMAYGLKHLPRDEQKDANAIYGTGNMLAGSLGTTIIAALMTSVHIASFSHVQNIVAGSRMAFGMLALLGVINFFLFRRLFKSSK